MGIRETLNKNPKATTGATIGLTVLALLLITWQLWPSSAPSVPDKAFFTTDNGKTWFVDDLYKIPPFRHKGLEAVRAHVYQVGENGEKFVGWMEKFPDQIKANIEKYYSDPKNRGTYFAQFYDDNFKLVKRPSDPNWYPGNFAILQQLRIQERNGTYAHEIFPDE